MINIEYTEYFSKNILFPRKLIDKSKYKNSILPKYNYSLYLSRNCDIYNIAYELLKELKHSALMPSNCLATRKTIYVDENANYTIGVNVIYFKDLDDMIYFQLKYC